MIRIFAALCILVLLAVQPAEAGLFDKNPASASAIPPVGAPMSFADLADTLSPAVVNISSTKKMDMSEGQAVPIMPDLPPGSPFEEFFKNYQNRNPLENPEGPMEAPVTSLGSGFIIDAAKGLVVTNNHVIKDADEVRVTLADNTILDAEILGRDEKTDLALLKIKNGTHKLTAVSFGDSDKMRVGDWVLAIGNPFGLGGTVTAGIISARKRDINAGPYDDFIQTDASINRGNSGGPMFDLKGEVIGINTAIYSPTGGSVGIGFAVPSNLAKPVIDQLIQYGKTRRGWLGVKIQTVTEEIAESFGLKGVHGALVASVTPKGPAEESKIQAGDIILEFNGQKLDAMRQLPRIVAETPIGTKVPVKIWREGKEIRLEAKVGELEKAEETGLVETAQNPEGETASKTTEIASLGVTTAAISPALRQVYNIPDDVNGVVITTVKTGSDAMLKGLSAGDVIIEANQQEIKDVAALTSVVADVQKQGKNSLLLLVDQAGQGDVRFVAVKFTPAKKDKK
ncbi:MAG: DegQ family serine endoprotease [Pseudobdellovibrionaceae bacterium]